ncbi:MAG: LCP family protein [Oscillospiraceae bacterium]|nr:LCP family protein [Oscillospiraceae bacterium]
MSKKSNSFSDTKPLPVKEAVKAAGKQSEKPTDAASIREKNSAAITKSHTGLKSEKQKPKRRGCNPLTILLIFVVLVFGVFSLISIWAIQQLRYEPTQLRQMIADDAVYEDEQIRNILVIGSDSRGDSGGRSDAMLLVTLSGRNKTITITSLMRDSYVSIPGHGCNKLNAAYVYGGATLLMDTIEANYHIDVDEYVVIDFSAFVAVIDAFGGMELTISDAEAEGMNIILQAELNLLMGDAVNADLLPGGGTYQMNGKQALAYSRLRYVGNADYERTQRQRTVMQKLLEQMKSLRPGAWFSLIEDALPLISTNMEPFSLYVLSLRAPILLAAYDIQTLRLPANNTYVNDTTETGAAVLVVDFDANLTIFKQTVEEPYAVQNTSEE